jgi:phosphoribosylcarboxyaminoimidazole (NCAIR) mutase
MAPVPVIGVPMLTPDLGGLDSLYSIVQMPGGVPVAAVGIGQGRGKECGYPGYSDFEHCGQGS